VELAGGDTAQWPAGLLADVVVVGRATSGTALLRSGAKPNDQIYVTGELGESAAALCLLRGRKIRKRDVFPKPRIAIGEWLRTNRIASAAIDISDGLSTDLAHICRESGVGAVLEAEAIPIHAAAQNLRRDGGRDLPLDLALHGGEDYELLFTAPRSQRVPPRIAGVKITRIGEVVTRTKKMSIVRQGQKEVLLPRGWEHFGSSSSGL
jgi:thiamine-monophosphate kinase